MIYKKKKKSSDLIKHQSSRMTQKILHMKDEND